MTLTVSRSCLHVVIVSEKAAAIWVRQYFPVRFHICRVDILRLGFRTLCHVAGAVAALEHHDVVVKRCSFGDADGSTCQDAKVNKKYRRQLARCTYDATVAYHSACRQRSLGFNHIIIAHLNEHMSQRLIPSKTKRAPSVPVHSSALQTS